MILSVHKYGAEITKRKKAPHPNSWGKLGITKNYEVRKHVVLQVTDVTKNNNKFYSLELHYNDKNEARLFSHYGRTDDLEKKGSDAGTKECRYGGKTQIESEFDKIIKSKKKKGYCEVNLAKSNIGSDKAQGQSAGFIDSKTLNALSSSKKKSIKANTKSNLDENIRNLVSLIYKEAGQALTQKANIKITAEGFATPLGVLTLGQVDSGFGIISDLREAIQKNNVDDIRRLSGDYYTTIPHRIGRTRKDIESAIIQTIQRTDEAEETLQLMKDMLNVNDGSSTNLFATDEVDERYQNLHTDIQFSNHW